MLAALLPLTEKEGDAKAGKDVFTKQCSKCHTHSGEGTKIGPDLTGMAVHPKAELLTHIIDHARATGCVNVQWQTPTANIDAIAFYERRHATRRDKARFTLPL